MNFLIKIEEAINHFIELVLNKLKALTPSFIFSILHFVKSSPQLIKTIYTKTQPKIKIFFLKCIGFIQHFITIFRGRLMAGVIYLRSEEFKKADKKTLLLAPIRFSKLHPIKAASRIALASFLLMATSIVYQNSAKIFSGTKAYRKIASNEAIEEDLFIEIKNKKFEVKVGPATAHGAAGEAHEFEIFLNLKIEAINSSEKKFLEHIEDTIDDKLEEIELPVSQLPLAAENNKIIEELILKELNEEVKQLGHDDSIKSVSIKQEIPSRPLYYRQSERMMKIEDINLQIFLEDTHRNRQVWLDFSMIATNRNCILYLQDHEVELRDHLTSNVEPVIPLLPIEEEGKRIIRDKIKAELNLFLEKNEIEGKVIEVYLDYLMAS